MESLRSKPSVRATSERLPRSSVKAISSRTVSNHDWCRKLQNYDRVVRLTGRCVVGVSIAETTVDHLIDPKVVDVSARNH